jgi:hypothetical protein
MMAEPDDTWAQAAWEGSTGGLGRFGRPIVDRVTQRTRNGELVLRPRRGTLKISTPEPASIALLGSGLVAFGLLRRRWRKGG